MPTFRSRKDKRANWLSWQWVENDLTDFPGDFCTFTFGRHTIICAPDIPKTIFEKGIQKCDYVYEVLIYLVQNATIVTPGTKFKMQGVVSQILAQFDPDSKKTAHFNGNIRFIMSYVTMHLQFGEENW